MIRKNRRCTHKTTQTWRFG